MLNTSVATPTILSTSDLNPHVDFGSPGSDAERAQSLALPADIVRESNGTVYVAATSSASSPIVTSGASTPTFNVSSSDYYVQPGDDVDCSRSASPRVAPGRGQR